MREFLSSMLSRQLIDPVPTPLNTYWSEVSPMGRIYFHNYLLSIYIESLAALARFEVNVHKKLDWASKIVYYYIDFLIC